MQALHSNSGSTASIERCMPAQINCRELLSDDSKSDEHGGAARGGCSPFLAARQRELRFVAGYNFLAAVTDQ